MTPEGALKIADEALFASTGSRMTDAQRLILQESLAGKKYEQMEGYSPQHIRNEGKVLWDLLSEALGEKVSKPNFKGALEKRLKSGGIVPKPPMLSNYDEQTWVGREAVIGDLLPKLQGHTRLLWITGISGIGKTTLGECLASQAWESDPSFQWIHLEILEGQSPDFASVAADLLAKLGDKDLDPQERNHPEQLAKRLLQKLQSCPYWIQLDSLERLLNPEQPTEFVDTYWAIFLQRCLTEQNFASRLVLTAQAFPTALVEFSDRYPNVWTEIRLNGLSEVEQRLEFFAKRGLVVEPTNQAILTQIAKIYEGHPLVLKVIAEDILNSFEGNVSRYWQIYQPEFEQVARELQATRVNETEYNEALDRKVRERIKKSIEQLPADALDLLCRSAVFRRPVPKKFWLAMIGDCTTKHQKAAYQVLGDRALIEKEGTDIRQHNLIRAVAYDLLKADPLTWKTAERQAAHLWLTAYKAAPNAPNLETVRGYLEAFDHYCEVKDWEQACETISNRLQVPIEEELHNQLGIWGYYQEQIYLYKNLLYKLNDNLDSICLNGLGNAYEIVGEYSLALECYQKRLRVLKNEDHEGLATVNGSLGNLCLAIGDYGKAIYFYQKQWGWAQKIQNRAVESQAIGNIGAACSGLGDYGGAMKFYKQSLEIEREIGNLQGINELLCNMGNNLLESGEYLSDALEYLQTSVELSRKIGDAYTETNSLWNLSVLHQKLDQVEIALEYCQQALVLATELGIPLKAECEALQQSLEASHA